MFASVAVPVPALPLLTYRVPPEMRRPVRGARVLVPLGTRTVTGLVVSIDVAPAEGDVKDVIEVLDEEPFLPGAIVDLALWVSDYYLAGPGDTLATAMPPGAWIESQLRYRLTTTGRAALQGADDGSARMQVLALFSWSVAGVIGVLVGDKLRFRKGSAYLDEIDDA